MAAILTQQLTRRFDRHVAVRQLCLEVPTGSVYGFLGRNGAGKTTTLKLLLGLLRPSAGRIWIDGLAMDSNRIAVARRIGALLEAHGFHPRLSGAANLDLTRRLLGLPVGEIARVLELVELQHQAGRPVSEYSLGMRQRLGIARALLGSPTVLLLDEPGNGLDPEGIIALRTFLRSLPERTGATVLVSSHQLTEIEQSVSHVGILADGRLVLQGELPQLLRTLPGELLLETSDNARAAALLRQWGNAAETFTGGDGAAMLRVPLDDAIEPRQTAALLAAALVREGVALHRLLPHRGGLEQLYRSAAAIGPVERLEQAA